MASRSSVPASGAKEDRDDECDREEVKEVGLRLAVVGEPILGVTGNNTKVT